jgi:uncharacterized protein
MPTERYFSLLVKPTSADCNLRCAYCFYLPKAALYPETPTHRMSEAVLERMIASYMGEGRQPFSFGWQGGEPTLMGAEFFRRVTELQNGYGVRGASVSNGLQTNATLITDELAAHLAEYNFLVGVSLDGPATIHDANRLTVDGRGSHAAVWRGIETLRRHRVEFNVLVLVNAANVGQPAEVYRYLRDHDVLFHQYIECVEFDAQGRLQPYAVTGEQWGDFLCGLFDEWVKADTRRVSVRLFDSIVTLMVEGFANVCHMGTDCRQYLLVEHNGDVYPCDFFVQPDLKLGNVATHTWAAMLASPAYEAFGARKAGWNAACRDCEFVRYCAGDCPKHRLGGGVEPSRLSWLCAGWKRFYRHALPGLEAIAADIRRGRAAEAASRRRDRAALWAGDGLGRNDPCRCGSGRKFKKCCGAGI